MASELDRSRKELVKHQSEVLASIEDRERALDSRSAGLVAAKKKIGAKTRKLQQKLARQEEQLAERIAEVQRREQEMEGRALDLDRAEEETDAGPGPAADALETLQASHAAVAAFWVNFDFTQAGLGTAPVETPPDDEVEEEAGVAPAAVEDRLTETAEVQDCVSKEPEFPEPDGDPEPDALHRALAAARAEIEAAENEPPPGLSPEEQRELDARAAADVAEDQVVKFTRDMASAEAAGESAEAQQSRRLQPARTFAQAEACGSGDTELDPETARKLRMLRRLNPTKSKQELLAQITLEKTGKSTGQKKRGWFSRK